MKLLDRPNIHLFRTCGKCYVYDVCNNVILRITAEAYQYLNEVIKYGMDSVGKLKENELVDKLVEEGFLQSHTVETIKHPMNDQVEDLLNNDLHMLTLQESSPKFGVNCLRYNWYQQLSFRFGVGAGAQSRGHA